jgi:hypothetical protein
VRKENKMGSNTMKDKKTNTKNKNTLTRGYGGKIIIIITTKGKKRGR